MTPTNKPTRAISDAARMWRFVTFHLLESGSSNDRRNTVRLGNRGDYCSRGAVVNGELLMALWSWSCGRRRHEGAEAGVKAGPPPQADPQGLRRQESQAPAERRVLVRPRHRLQRVGHGEGESCV